MEDADKKLIVLSFLGLGTGYWLLGRGKPLTVGYGAAFSSRKRRGARLSSRKTTSVSHKKRGLSRPTYPNFKSACPALSSTASIDSNLSAISSALVPSLNVWISSLQEATASLNVVLDKVEESHSPSTLSWLIDWGVSLFGASSASESASQETNNLKTAIRNINRYLGSIAGLRNRLINDRMPASQISSICAMSNREMGEYIAPSFGISNREMLKGWWSDTSRYEGGLEPWQQVCDLTSHRVDPLPHYYGSVTASVDGRVFALQPRVGDPRYQQISTNTLTAWGIRTEESGCLPSQSCPVVTRHSPSPAVSSLKRDMELILQLCSDSGFNNVVNAFSSSVDSAQSISQSRSSRLKQWRDMLYLAAVKSPVKSSIVSVLSGPTNATFIAVGTALGGPVGGALGALSATVANPIMADNIYDGLISGVNSDYHDSLSISNDLLPTLKPIVVEKVRSFHSIVSSTEREGISGIVSSALSGLDSWLALWQSLGAKCRTAYPSRTASQWRAMGVPNECSRAPITYDRVISGSFAPPPRTAIGRGRERGRGGPRAVDGHAVRVLLGGILPETKTVSWKSFAIIAGVYYVWRTYEK